MRYFTLTVLGVVLGSFSVVAAPPGQADVVKGKKRAESACLACHGVNGNSVVGMFPRLAGQHMLYSYQQARAIKNGTRTYGQSFAMQSASELAHLTDQDMLDAAAYYALQQPKTGKNRSDSNSVALGRKLYHAGKPERKLAACAACHGANGAGIPDIFPRVAPQHADYTKIQLNAYRSGARKHVMMDSSVVTLSDEEINALADYLQGLH